jgi:thiamine biosynthesis lipoprotein
MLTFRAMNTDVRVVASPQIGEAVAVVFAEAEQRFSRFREDSELSQLNRASSMIVSQPMFDALVAARQYVELTNGVFDPAIGSALVALGYDRSFAPGTLDREHGAATVRAATFRDVELDAATREVRRPANVMIDMGGMIKGRTVDEASRLLPRTGAIDAGGDAVLRGGSWTVHVEDPRDPTRTIATLRIRDRAVATSAANRRKWRVGRFARHHLVDPRTQESAATDLLQVTVVAATAELADVLAKTAFVLGADAGQAFLAKFEVTAVLVPTSGAPIEVAS